MDTGNTIPDSFVSTTQKTSSQSVSWFYPFFIFIIALTIRLIVLVQFKEMNPLFEHPVIDAWRYDTLAKNFLTLGSWPEKGAFLQPPAYPAFLALIYTLFGESHTWARIIQACLGSLSCVFIYYIGFHIHSKRIGLTSGLITAFYGPLIFFEMDLLAPVLIVFWSSLGLLLFITGLQKLKNTFLMASGFCMGVALISWPIIGLSCAFLALVHCWSFHRNPRNCSIQIIVFSLGVLLPVLPVFLHNILHGEWVLISTNGGINFFIGNNPDWQQTVAGRPGYPWEKIVTLPYQIYGVDKVNEIGSSSLFFQEAVNFISSHPAEYIKNQLIKLYQVAYGYEIMRNTDLYFFKQFSSVLDSMIFSSKWLHFPFGLLFPFASIGFIFSFPQLGKENKYLIGYLISVCAGLFLFFVTARYRVVLVPVLSIYAALGAWELFFALQNKQKQGWLLLALLLSIGICTNTDIFNQQNHFKRGVYQAQAPFTLGRIYLEQGKMDEALNWLEKSIQIDPSYPDAWVDLGRAKYLLGDVNGAIESMNQAAITAPDYPLPYYNLGLIYDKPYLPPSKAIEFYQKYLTRADAYFDAHILGQERQTTVRKRLNTLISQHQNQ